MLSVYFVNEGIKVVKNGGIPWFYGKNGVGGIAIYGDMAAGMTNLRIFAP
jgi:hypothetical protein